MEDEELIAIAKEEKIFLGLTFNKEKIIENLEKKGYKRKIVLGLYTRIRAFDKE